MSTTSSAARAQVAQKEMDDEEVRVNRITEALKGSSLGGGTVRDDEDDDEDDDDDDENENESMTPVATATATNSEKSPTPPSARPAAQTETATPTKENRFKKNRNASAKKTPSVFARDTTAGTHVGQRQGLGQPSGNTQYPNNGSAGTGPGAATTTGVASKYTVEGSNIGSTAQEPVWSGEQLQMIAKLKSMRLNSASMTETRRSARDPAGKYVGMTQEGAVSARPAAWLGNIPWNEFKVGMGKPKPDEKTGKGKIYSDIVMKGNDWVLNQWTMNGVVMEGVPEHILDKPPRIIGGRPERRIGHDFVRIGLPAMAVAPVLETIRSGMPNVMSTMSVTSGFYWVNASWGVTGNPGKYVYKDSNGIMQTTFKAYEAMKMIMGSSSMGVATIAISVGNNAKMQDGRMVAVAGEEEFSIKIHNMFHLSKVPYSSPPQSAANGFDVSQEIYDLAESLTMPSTMSGMFAQTAGAFNDTGMNPFANVSSPVASGTVGQQGQQTMRLL